MVMEFIASEWASNGWQEQYDDIRLKYKECRNYLLALRIKQSRREQLLIEQNDLKKKISVFETEETKQLLSHHTELARQKEIIGDIYDQYVDLIGFVNKLNSLKTKRDTNEIDSLDKKTYNKLVLWISQLNSLQSDLQTVLQKYSSVALSMEDLLESLPIKALITENASKLDELLATLLKNGVEGIDQYKFLIAEREKLFLKLNEYPDVKQNIAEQEQKSKDLINELKLLIKKRYKERSRVIAFSYKHMTITKN